jgi:hypothetical protein
MTNEGNPISAIESLLAERRRYEAWMATLETRRETTPAHVYERVRTDYEARLKEVLGRLTGRSSDLKQMVETLAGKVASLESDETTRRDALAEAELRALVGEYEPSEWERLKAERDAEIERLKLERGELSGELAKVQELLSAANAEPRFATPAPGVLASQPPAVGAGVAAGRPGAPPTAPRAPAGIPAGAAGVLASQPPAVGAGVAAGRRGAPPTAPSAPAGIPAGAPAGSSAPVPAGFDELAFLQSLGDARNPGSAQPAAAAPAATVPPAVPAAPPPAAAAPVADAARALADDLAARGTLATPADVVSQRAGAQTMRPAANPAAEPRAPQPAADRGPSRESVPSFLRDVPSEQVKTLKCQECGTMNYPTEWYCERCGGELAAM